ncbi:hypothetical protein HK405_006700 [Cladochytrium tenue]|nr:hypothetical protein HK405_006700 [Cladochytrium tenue]
MREEAERRRRAEQAQYVSTFCSRIAATQNASRPRTVALLKHYYVKYRAENPDSGGPSPTVGSAAVTSMTQADAALLNDPREVLESNKNGVTVTDVQQALIQELVQGRQGGGDGDDGDESVLDHDGAAFVPVSSRAIEVPIILRFMPSARLLPGEDPAARSRTLVRPPYLLVGHPGLSVELRPRSAARTGPISVELGKNLFFVMRIAPTHHGVVKDAVVFNFGSFVICRYVSLRVEDPAIKEDAKAHRAATPYTGVLAPRAVPVLSSTHIISGVPPSK